jgi:hypothetical protein
VQVNLENRVRPMPVVHPSTIRLRMLKLSPEGEGFTPPKGGQ